MFLLVIKRRCDEPQRSTGCAKINDSNTCRTVQPQLHEHAKFGESAK